MKTDNQLQHFILKEDGNIYWIESMPLEPSPIYTNDRASDVYKQALQHAIDNSIKVSNQEETLKQLIDPAGMSGVRNWTKYISDNPELPTL